MPASLAEADMPASLAEAGMSVLLVPKPMDTSVLPSMRLQRQLDTAYTQAQLVLLDTMHLYHMVVEDLQVVVADQNLQKESQMKINETITPLN